MITNDIEAFFKNGFYSKNAKERIWAFALNTDFIGIKKSGLNLFVSNL